MTLQSLRQLWMTLLHVSQKQTLHTEALVAHETSQVLLWHWLHKALLIFLQWRRCLAWFALNAGILQIFSDDFLVRSPGGCYHFLQLLLLDNVVHSDSLVGANLVKDLRCSVSSVVESQLGLVPEVLLALRTPEEVDLDSQVTSQVNLEVDIVLESSLADRTPIKRNIQNQHQPRLI